MPKFNPEQSLWECRREFGEHGGVAPSISRSSTFTVIDPETIAQIFEGIRGPDKGGCFLYSRHFNPTVEVLSRYLAAMEGAEGAACMASGMAAISCALLQLCKSGDHIVSSEVVYGGTHALLAELLPEYNITTTFVDPSDTKAFENAIRSNTRVLYTEAIGNPTLKVSDIPALSKIARDNDLSLVVDNTFSPMMISPIRLGADVVIHSMTKFINGASDVIAGAICTDREFIYRLMDLHTGRAMLFGPTMDPRVAFDIIQRLPHLSIRMKEHSRRTMAIARHLERLGVPVSYPGLESHLHHERLSAMINEGYGYGGLMTIDCKTQEKADEFMAILQNRERFGFIAVSLGYFDSLMSCSGSTTSSELTLEEQTSMGLSPGLVRMSIGYTGDLKDRIQQIERAVREVKLI